MVCDHPRYPVKIWDNCKKISSRSLLLMIRLLWNLSSALLDWYQKKSFCVQRHTKRNLCPHTEWHLHESPLMKYVYSGHDLGVDPMGHKWNGHPGGSYKCTVEFFPWNHRNSILISVKEFRLLWAKIGEIFKMRKFKFPLCGELMMTRRKKERTDLRPGLKSAIFMDVVK